jgi:sulfur-oxidizing protein SoxA
MKNIRATPYKEGGEEFQALELYLASRGNGLTVETPSVRN